MDGAFYYESRLSRQSASASTLFLSLSIQVRVRGNSHLGPRSHPLSSFCHQLVCFHVGSNMNVVEAPKRYVHAYVYETLVDFESNVSAGSLLLALQFVPASSSFSIAALAPSIFTLKSTFHPNIHLYHLSDLIIGSAHVNSPLLWSCSVYHYYSHTHHKRQSPHNISCCDLIQASPDSLNHGCVT